MKKLTIQLLLVFSAIYGVSQEGSGGVGETDGTSSLLLWLNADYTKQASGIHVGLWLDQSGYSNHARPESGLGPTYSKDSSSKKGQEYHQQYCNCPNKVQTKYSLLIYSK